MSKYSITIQLPNGTFFSIQYDNEKTATAFLEHFAKEAAKSSLDEVVTAIAKDSAELAMDQVNSTSPGKPKWTQHKAELQ